MQRDGARIDAGREGAYATLVQEHGAAVRATANRICGPDRAADVAQEVFLKYWSNPDRFDPTRGSLRTYLLVMARGAAIDTVRQRTAQLRRDHNSVEAFGGIEASPHDRLERDELAVRMATAMSTLHPDDRDAIWMAFFQETTYREVAAQLGLPEGTVKSRIRRGLKALHGELLDLRSSPIASGGLTGLSPA